MKKILTLLGVLFSVVMLSVPSMSLAATPGFYTSFGVGSISYNGLKPSRVESRLLNTAGVTGSFSKDESSLFSEIGGGYCFNTYVCADIGYARGVKMNTVTRITSIDAGSIDLNGTTFNLGSYGTNITISREAEASSVHLGVSGEYPLSSRVSALARIRFDRWNANVVDKVSVDNSGIYLAFNESDSGTSPTASLGLNIKLIKKATLDVEYMHIKNVTMSSLRVRYPL